jgi:rubrerythrin
MTTYVGTQTHFSDALKALVELDYDAIEAYEAAINRLENQEYIEKMQSFMEDHRRHVEELQILLESHNETCPTGPSLGKQWITKGKVVFADLMGDTTILKAMASNEEDTNDAYERMTKRQDQWSDARELLERGLEDERRHKQWLDAMS